MAKCTQEEAIEQAGPTFDPPLYIQRYTTVCDILYKFPKIEKVVDFGCSEGKFIKYLKGLPFVREIACVDIHDPSVHFASRVAQPLAWDFIFKRFQDLTIKMFCGSVLHKDARLQGYNAVTCIELIEHLQPEDLVPLTYNIFSFIRPKVAIFTTPNSEFNVLFSQVKNFRHWDHKFEWTRSEFTDWCKSVVDEYPDYEYEIKGIGCPPAESADVGCCSQLAAFTLISSKADCSNFQDFIDEPYVLMKEHYYPARLKEDKDKSEIPD